MRRDFHPALIFSCQPLRRRARDRLEVRGVAMEQPLQTLFNVKNIWNANDQVAVRLEHARKLAQRLLWILDVFETFKTSYVIERFIAKRQFRIEVPLMNIDSLKPKYFRI